MKETRGVVDLCLYIYIHTGKLTNLLNLINKCDFGDREIKGGINERESLGFLYSFIFIYMYLCFCQKPKRV